MKEKQIHEIKQKKKADKKKLLDLFYLSILYIIIRCGIYFKCYLTDSHTGGAIIELLWLPIILLILALPFYTFEWLLDKLKK